MILSNLDQVPGTLWSLLLLAHFTGEKTILERQSKGRSSDSSQGQCGSRTCALKLCCIPVCTHRWKKDAAQRGNAQAKARRPPKIHNVLGKGVTGPLGKEGSIRGQTEEGCLSLADGWPPWDAVQLQSHGPTED